MIAVEVVAIGSGGLVRYGSVASHVRVTERLLRGGSTGELHTELVPVPYMKRYDDHADSSPRMWAARFHLARWGLYLAEKAGVVVGGSAIAPGDDPLVGVGTGDAALLWDIRVSTVHHRAGIATALLHAAERWAAEAGHSRIVAETQDVNVAACRFYHAMGFRLATWDHGAYAEAPGECRLVWQRAIPQLTPGQLP